MKPRLIDDMNGDNIICLVYQKESGRVVGYIELEMLDIHNPKVEIGIMECDRRKGYAFEAFALLVNKTFENGEIECIEWMTTSGNEASNRIVQKLGGKVIRKNPIIPDEVMDRWSNDFLSESEIPCYNVYGIYRETLCFLK